MRCFFLIMIFAALMKPMEAMCQPVGKASFLATTSAGFDVKGSDAKVIAEELRKDASSISGHFSVILAEFKTGMDLRDKHFCETVDCKKFPKAELWLDPIQVGGSKEMTGRLKLHGVEKPVKGSVEFLAVGAVATIKIKLSDFSIKAPNYKLVSVSDDVTIGVQVSNL